MTKMTATRALRRRKEIAHSKERENLRYEMSFLPFETEDGKKEQTKIGGKTRSNAARWDR